MAKRRRKFAYLSSPVKTSCCTSDTAESKESIETMSLKQILLNLDFHLFSWTFVFAAAIGLVFLNNLTTISQSVELSDRNSVLLIIDSVQIIPVPIPHNTVDMTRTANIDAFHIVNAKLPVKNAHDSKIRIIRGTLAIHMTIP
jgi:hypothetical protein